MNHIIPASDQNALSSDRPRRHAYVTPFVDVQSTEEGFVLQAEMPGVSKTVIEVTVENGDLTLVGHRESQDTSGDPVYLERQPADYRRVYELDPSIDTSRISARIDRSVLTVTLPKAENVKPRKIALD
jgi:HSP20 family protein